MAAASLLLCSFLKCFFGLYIYKQWILPSSIINVGLSQAHPNHYCSADYYAAQALSKFRPAALLQIYILHNYSIYTRQDELWNEAKLIMLSNKPRVVVTDFRLHLCGVTEWLLEETHLHDSATYISISLRSRLGRNLNAKVIWSTSNLHIRLKYTMSRC